MDLIHLNLLCAKNTSGYNRRAVLQALRKKWFEEHLKYVDHAIKAKSVCTNKEMIKVNDLIKGITLEDDITEDVLGNLFYKSVKQKVEFKEDELLVELERLRKSWKQSPIGVEDSAHHFPALTSGPVIVEEDDIEEELEWLRCWANESL